MIRRPTMTVEVIDLLSSPDPSEDATRKYNAQPKDNGSAVSKLPRNGPVSKTSSTTEPGRKRADDKWFTLSSDSDIEPVLKPNPNPRSKPKASNNPAAPITLSKPPRDDASHQPLQATTDKVKGVFFNSDDFEFDSTMNLTSPDLFPQPARKKRRLSLSSLSSSSSEIQILPDITTQKEKENGVAKLAQPRVMGSRLQRSVSYTQTASGYKSNGDGAVNGAGISRGLQRSRTVGVVQESDPIVFTSSPDPFEDIARRRRERMKRLEKLGEESDEENEDIFGLGTSSTTTTKKTRDTYDMSSDMELPDLADLAANSTRGGAGQKNSILIVDEYYAERAKEKKAKDVEGRDKERRDKKAVKDAEKVRKRLERQEKANEKERMAELARVNVVRSNKQKSSQEMTVDIPSKLADSVFGQQVIKLLEKAEIKHSTWESDSSLVKWRREVTSDYNEEAGQWEPVPRRIELEKHVVFVMTAKEFVELAIGEGGEDINSHVQGLKTKFPTGKAIYLIEGLTPWMRKNRMIQNKRYTESVRNVGREEPVPSQRSRKKQEEYVDGDLVEDALLRLQVMHGALIHHTSAMVETAEWILVFTQHISTVPYRLREQALNTTFCMDGGQVRTGDDAAETFVRMLQEMVQITAAAAYGIVAEYPTVRDLVGALQRDGPLALQDCRKTANKNGAFTDRRVGPSISKRLHTVFTSSDEWSLNV